MRLHHEWAQLLAATHANVPQHRQTDPLDPTQTRPPDPAEPILGAKRDRRRQESRDHLDQSASRRQIVIRFLYFHIDHLFLFLK